MKMIENLGAPAILIFAGALISAIGAMWAAQQQLASEKELRQKSDEIAELNKEIKLSITGGNSFAYLIPSFSTKAENSSILTLVHQGKYSLYDLQVRVVDLDKFEKMKRQNKDYSIIDASVVLNIGNLAPNRAQMLQTIQIVGESLRWNIFFNARNGFFDQLLRLQRIGNEWKIALKVSSSPSAGEEVKTLFERIDPGYPRGKDGQVEW